MPTEFITDMSNAREKTFLIGALAKLQGPHRVTIVKHKKRRSDRQNRYYWPCFVQPSGEYLREQGQSITDDEVHEGFKLMFLRRTVVDGVTGNHFDVVGSSAALNTVQFNDYLDQCAAYIAETFGIVVPEPSIYHERDEEGSEAA